MAKSISRYLADISSTSGVLDGTLSTAAQTNITSLGTLSSLTVSGAMNGTLSTAAQPNITSLGTLTALTVDDITINGYAISSSAANLHIDASGDIILDADGGDVFIDDGGTRLLSISNAGSNNVQISTSISDGDLLFKGNDGGSTITALTLDMSEAGTATFNSDVYIKKHLRLLTTDDQANDWVIYTHTDDSLRFNYNGSGNDEVKVATTGALTINAAYTFPTSDGSNGQVLTTNGSGTLSFTTISGTTINSNTNNYLITGTGTANTLQGESGLTFDGTTLTSSGNQIITTTNNEWLAYNGSGTSPYLRMKTSGTNNGYIQFTTTSSFFWNDRIGRGIRLSNTAYPEFYDGSYRTMWHSGNAPIAVNGANNVLKANGNGYLQIDNWIRVTGGTGLYTDVSSGAYFYESTSPAGYQGWYVRSRSSGSVSLIMQQNDGTQTGHIYAGTDSNRFQQGFLKSNGGWAAKSDANANWVVTGTVYDSSDARLKSNVQPISNALTKVTQLKGVTYTRNSTMKTEIGMIAQDVKAVVPELVEIMEGEDNKYEVPDMHTMSYERVVPLLIEAIKELKAQLDAK